MTRIRLHLSSLLLLVLFAFVAAGSDPGPSGGAGESRTATPRTPDKTEAWVMAQKFVKDKLKSPSSADFGSVFGGDYQNSNEVVTDLGGGKFRVRAWVDAQNAFGAKLRNHFRV